ncbi:MAG: cobyric acid synthase [Alphaproteobacteria bacterium]|nr:cobyric acid synthase [Alphaproteobacteria bacterium]
MASQQHQPSPLALMLQGTGSDVGKSMLLAGLARALVRRGLKVRPFKPQNMSNNAAATIEGGEIGRAQALQAQACYLPPTIWMNPILLKPEAAGRAQVIVLGQRETTLKAADYQNYKAGLLPRVLSAWQKWQGAINLDGKTYPAPDMMLVEGAGSASEVNLRENDLANMGFATATKTPVILVADIDRGGVIASIIGTWQVLPPDERALLRGYIINKFRGDTALFAPAILRIKAETGLECLGIVPWFAAAALLPAEDSLGLGKYAPKNGAAAQELNSDNPKKIRIAVPQLPHIANFDDLDPLVAEPRIDLSFITPGQVIGGDVDVVILPGSKSTLADLAFLRAQGWDIDILAHVRQGGFVLGLCGGYQMLGQSISDPDGIESATPGERAMGLGLLAVDTILHKHKQVGRRDGMAMGHPVTGYEIHLGETLGADAHRPMIAPAPDSQYPAEGGAMSPSGLVMGCYLHGIFGNNGFRQAYLQQIHADFHSELDYGHNIDRILDDLAVHLESVLNIDQILSIAGEESMVSF